MRKTMIGAALLALACNGQAGVAGWTAPAKVLTLEANDLGRFTLTLDVEDNVSGCRDERGFYVDYGRDGTELMYRMLLDALTQDRKVQVHVTGVCELKGKSAVSAVRLLP